MPLVVATDRGPVRVLEMARPEARNAMNTALLTELLDALHKANNDEALRGVVLTGAGGAFSAGADLREPLDHEAAVSRMDLFCEVYEAVAGCRLPTIAAIAGPCVGGGAEVAAACDLRVADETATFRFPGAALGFPVGAAKLVGLVGLGTAKDLVLTSRTIAAAEAMRLGLVQRLAEPGGSLDLAVEIAEEIVANDPEAVITLKRMLTRFSGLETRLAEENRALRHHARDGFSGLD